MRALTLAALFFAAAGPALLALPAVQAHPVVWRCSGMTGVNPQAYLAQFEPADPNTWGSSVAYVTVPPPVCGMTCRQWEPHCYPMPCFYTYGGEPDPADCDGHVPVALPDITGSSAVPGPAQPEASRPAAARTLP